MFQFIQAALDDDHGISEIAWLRLISMVTFMPESEEKDRILVLMETVEAVDGRFFLAK